jgi:protein-tyrosine phosphatase
MIDVHFHCLPGIDDGPKDWDEAAALCRVAAAEGTTTVIATPHVLRDKWVNSDPAARDELILRLNDLLGQKPTVLAGCEYFFSLDAVQLVERGRWGPLTYLNHTRSLLVEFPPGPLPPSTDGIFHEFSILDVTPVIAHPERNSLFAANPERLEALVDRGALVQITAGSLLGDFGSGPRAACEEFFRRGLIHLVASDAHSLDRRPPRLSAARERVRRDWGEESEITIFEANPRALLQSEPVRSIGPTPKASSAR